MNAFLLLLNVLLPAPTTMNTRFPPSSNTMLLNSFMSLVLASSLRTTFLSKMHIKLLSFFRIFSQLLLKDLTASTLIGTHLKDDKSEKSCGFAVCREGSKMLNLRPKLRLGSELNKTHWTVFYSWPKRLGQSQVLSQCLSFLSTGSTPVVPHSKSSWQQPQTKGKH